MKSSPILCIVGMIAWIVTALAAIHLGLMPLGYNVFTMEFMMNTSPQVIKWIHYLVGICGLISLIMFFMKWSSGCKCRCK